MAFNAYGAGENSGKQSTIDWNAINKYVVDTAGLQERETLVGVVASIVDLGTQKQPDAEVAFTGDASDEAKAIAEKPQTYFKDGIDQTTKKPVRLKCWPQKPIQCVAVAVDFPDILIDKGQFFGDEGKAMPLRLWLGGQFYIKDAGMVVGRPTPLKVKKDEKGRWSFDKKHLFHKMAVASKLIGSDDVFLPQDIDKLLGKAFQFEAQVNYDKGGYYKEYIKFVGGLGRKMDAPEYNLPLYVVGFDDDNSDDAVKNIRNHVLNTIKLATNYEGSKLATQIEAVKGKRETSSVEDASKQEAKPEPVKYTADESELDLPF
jgi:hypothetical protein